MNLTGLGAGDFGDEVAWLHEELAKRGLDASVDEQKRKFFGPTTREAVRKFQTIHGISQSCEVCEKTAALLASQPAASPSAELTPPAKTLANESRQPGVVGSAGPAQPPQPSIPIPVFEFEHQVSAVRSPVVNGDGSERQTADGAITKIFYAFGRVIHCQTRTGVSGLRVETWDKAALCPELVDCTFTDDEGQFEIALSEPYLVALFGDHYPELVFRIFRGDQFLQHRDSISWNLHATPSRGLLLRIYVGSDPPSDASSLRPTPAVVRGRAAHAIKGPLPGHTVTAFDQNLRAQTQLGTPVITNEQGRFAISYTPEPLLPFGKDKADLFLRLTDPRGVEIARTKVICHAPSTSSVDIVVGGDALRRPSEFERLSLALLPRIRVARGTDLSEEEVHLLACSTGLTESLVKTFLASARIAGKSGIRHEFIYAIVRAAGVTDRRTVFSQNPATQRRALEAALKANVIPGRLFDLLEDALHKVEQASIDLALESPNPSAVPSLLEVLRTVLPTDAAAREFVSVQRQHQGSSKYFWARLAERSTFASLGVLESLQFVIQIDAATRHHLPMVRALQRMRVSGRIRTSRDLARLTESDWASLIDSSIDGTPVGTPNAIVGATPTEKASKYASALAETMEHAFPTVAMSSRMSRDTLPGSMASANFLDTNPSFEFGKIRLSRYLADNPRALTAVQADQRKGVIEHLSAVERLLNLTHRYQYMRPLLIDRLLSAQAIHRMGKNRFVEKYAGLLGSDVAVSIAAKAEKVGTAALALFVRYHSATNSTAAYVLPGIEGFKKDPQGYLDSLKPGKIGAEGGVDRRAEKEPS